MFVRVTRMSRGDCSRGGAVRLIAVLLALAIASPRGAGAEEPTTTGVVAPTGTPAPMATGTPAPTNAVPAAGGLDFDLFGDTPKKAMSATPATPGVDLKATAPDLEKLERKVRLRRSMLQLHQGFGFATLGLLAVTLVIGQLNYIDKYGGGDFTGRYQYPHLGLALASSASFATGGLLGVLSPTPYPKPIRADAALLHKVMMSIATAGMAAQLALGVVTAAKGGELIQRDLALTHMVIGYGTFASMLTGYLAFVF